MINPLMYLGAATKRLQNFTRQEPHHDGKCWMRSVRRFSNAHV